MRKMQSKKILKWFRSIMNIGGITFSSIFIVFILVPDLLSQGYYFEPISEFSGNLVKSTIKSPHITSPKIQSGSTLPIRLSIPRIRVNTTIEHIGLTVHGEMDTPKGRKNAGWFNLGPRPGEKGSAVIDGHYGVWKNGEVSVFNNLHKLRKGDKLYIENENGTIVTFMVEKLQTYKQNADSSSIFISKDGKSHLNLITCQGTWNKYQKSYPNRLVIFTSKVVEK